MALNLKTSWVCIATSGSVVHGKEDGRFIKKEWLQGMADNYNEKVFSAKIWPDHYRHYSGGKVLALKVEPAQQEELKGELQLFAILSPDEWMVRANRAGDYTHTSIEVGENYLGKGGYFLKGLAVTNDPASAGTTELKFCRDDGTAEVHQLFNGLAINVADSLDDTPEKTSLFRRIFGNGDTAPNTPPETSTENKPMNEEQQKAFAASITASLTTAFDAKFKSLEAKIDPEEEPEETVPGVDATAFKALQDENAALKTGFDTLTAEFEAFKNAESDSTDDDQDPADQSKRCL